MLDLLDGPAERLEVERYAAEYPEIRAEIVGIEIALEAYAEASAKPPRAGLLGPLLAAAALTNTSSNVPPPPKERAAAEPATSPETTTNWLPWLLAALLGLGALYLFFSGRSKVNELDQDKTALQSSLATLEEDCNATSAALSASQQRNVVLTNPATQSILLAGSENAPESEAIVFYNGELDQTIFRAINLPRPPAGRQYQLWAIDAEGPVSLGVLSLDLQEDTLLDVQYVPGAAAFAISLEAEGGKPTPDMTQIQVIGAI